ncbi:MAG: GNAT family N-acetyltransferase, partial [Planktomarina sp.]
MYEELNTARLRLVPRSQDDPRDLSDALNDADVIRWLSHVPFPYSMADAKEFLNTSQFPNGLEWSIYDATGLVGAISVDGNMGYWLRTSAWGKGYMTEAGDAAIDAFFLGTASDTLTVHHAVENIASRRVIEKMGFEFTHMDDSHYPARGRTIPSCHYQLSRDRWKSRREFNIKAPGLILRDLRADDWPDVQRLAQDPDVARMMSSISSPWPDEDAKRWTAFGAYRGRLGFFAAICLEDGSLVGVLMFDKELQTPLIGLGYFIDKKYWGQGIATNAARAF